MCKFLILRRAWTSSKCGQYAGHGGSRKLCLQLTERLARNVVVEEQGQAVTVQVVRWTRSARASSCVVVVVEMVGRPVVLIAPDGPPFDTVQRAVKWQIRIGPTTSFASARPQTQRPQMCSGGSGQTRNTIVVATVHEPTTTAAAASAAQACRRRRRRNYKQHKGVTQVEQANRNALPPPTAARKAFTACVHPLQSEVRTITTGAAFAAADTTAWLKQSRAPM